MSLGNHFWCIASFIPHSNHFQGASQLSQWQRIHLPMQKMQVQSPDGGDPLEKEWQPTPNVLA